MLLEHRSHDYRDLIRRWKTLARAVRMECAVYAEIDGYPLHLLRTRRPTPGACQIYLSAGIHGDESGATEGLIAWATEHAEMLGRASFLIFPCLNPWGLINNSRYDASGHDLNRCFHHDEISAVRIQKELVPAGHFDLALTLHEDFDAQGIYIYEVQPDTEPWGPQLLQKAARIIPPDPRRFIDGHRVSAPGYLCRRPGRNAIVTGPEAIFLHERAVPHVFTFETPSEHLLRVRIAAHRRLVQSAVLRTLNGRW